MACSTSKLPVLASCIVLLMYLKDGGHAFGRFLWPAHTPVKTLRSVQRSTRKCVPPTCCLCDIRQTYAYSQNMLQTRQEQPQGVGQVSSGRVGGGPAPPGGAAQTPLDVNGQGPLAASYSGNPSGMNGVQSLGPIPGAMSGMPAANHHPTLQHLQPRMPGYPAPGSGMQMPPFFVQRGPSTHVPQGGPMAMGHMGSMAQMGQPPQRMPNGAIYAQNPGYRPQPGQQSPHQQQDMQTTGASGSPKQPGLASSTAQNSSPHLQGANGAASEVCILPRDGRAVT